jgi:hypothetical protein
MRINDADSGAELSRDVKSYPTKRKQPQPLERETDAILRRLLPAYRHMKKFSEHDNQQTVE